MKGREEWGRKRKEKKKERKGKERERRGTLVNLINLSIIAN